MVIIIGYSAIAVGSVAVAGTGQFAILLDGTRSACRTILAAAHRIDPFRLADSGSNLADSGTSPAPERQRTDPDRK